ncbi:hypothetical protein NHQ30_005176 [Ciborinia camelliae]|nr:hypothetical protein NHQ30_005176 [Ciborinia camelliae]
MVMAMVGGQPIIGGRAIAALFTRITDLSHRPWKDGTYDEIGTKLPKGEPVTSPPERETDFGSRQDDNPFEDEYSDSKSSDNCDSGETISRNVSPPHIYCTVMSHEYSDGKSSDNCDSEKTVSRNIEEAWGPNANMEPLGLRHNGSAHKSSSMKLEGTEDCPHSRSHSELTVLWNGCGERDGEAEGLRCRGFGGLIHQQTLLRQPFPLENSGHEDPTSASSSALENLAQQIYNILSVSETQSTGAIKNSPV